MSREFSTGSVRDDASGKPAIAQIPTEALSRLGMRFRLGEDRYGRFNFRLGQPILESLDSMLRHYADYCEGDESEDHIAAVAWNAMNALFVDEQIRRGKLPAELDDRPCKIDHGVVENPPPEPPDRKELASWYIKKHRGGD